jgi:hypothetical protein
MKLASDPTMSSTQVAENPVETFLWVRGKLAELKGRGMPVKTKSPLSKALDKISCFPLMLMSLTKPTLPEMTFLLMERQRAPWTNLMWV